MRNACLTPTLLLLSAMLAAMHASATWASLGSTSPEPRSGVAARSATTQARAPRQGHDRFIVGFAKGADDSIGRQRALDRAAAAQGMRASDLHATVGGMRVVRTSRHLDERAATQFLDHLRRETGVVYAVRDGRLKIALTPNDPLYAQQWALGAGPPENGDIRADLAWNRTLGQGILVAVLDTGITPHPDLAGQLVAGRDFITDLPTADDGDGRDADPTDPGDWNLADQCDPVQGARNSSWHGTHMAGVVAAAANNAEGVSGTAPAATVMPVRVLGHCGGFTSDVADAILWAAGGSVSGVPANPLPVDVINLSLGGEEPCILPLQSAIDFAVSQGVVVVASAGNDAYDARAKAPANCNGVIVVGASNRVGDRAGYSNVGTILDLSAPGGGGSTGILSTHNTGATTIGTPSYIQFNGTSPAAAHVSGIVALIQSIAPSTPESVEHILAGTTRPFSLPCLDSRCGSGIADANAAVNAAVDGAIMIGDAEVFEGSSGNTLVSVEVRLSRPMPGPVSFNLTTAAGPYTWDSASTPEDFEALSLIGETFAPGTLSRKYTLKVLGDALPERDELFRVLLTNVQGVAVARGAGRVSIIEDDPVPLVNGVTVGPFNAGAMGQRQLFSIEVPEGASSLTFTFPSDGFLEIAVLPGARPEVGQGDCASYFFAEPICTYLAPQPGTWYVILYGGDYAQARLTATYQAAALPLLSIGDATVQEGNAGTRMLSFPVTLSAAATSNVQFDVVVEDGMAHAGQDFDLPAPQSRTIAAGQSSTVVEVPVLGDLHIEGNETLAVEVRNVQGATVSRQRAQGRIANDDMATLSIGDIAVTETDGASTAVLAVSLSAPMPSPVAFDVRTVAGSANPTSDFITRALTGRYLDAGRTRQLFEVALVGDDVAEARESFTVVVENLTGALPGDLSATVSVADDDAPTVAVKRSAASAPPRAARLSGERTR